MTTRTSARSVSIAPDHNQPTLSKGQKAFNALVKRIEKRRASLSEWEVFVPGFHRKYVEELLPLKEQYLDLRIDMACCLDAASERKGLSAPERRTMAKLVTTMAENLLTERQDARLKVIYNRRSGSDYDREAAAELEDFKANLEKMLGAELGDDLDMSSREEVLSRVYERMSQNEAKANAANEPTEEKPETTRKKSAQQLAAEKRQLEEAAQRNLSIRELYRKLASEFHPDRESDPEVRKRKTALMQRANEAYKKKNLLQLLELQLELEQVDQNAINVISEDRLKHYNQILKQQVADLDQEIIRVETELKATYGLHPYDLITPKSMTREIANEIQWHKERLVEIKEDLIDFEDIRNVKAWLKDVTEDIKLREKIARIDITRYFTPE